MNNLLLSVIIPVFNSEDTICDCIDTLLTVKDLQTEIIIIDDGSTDNSPTLCDRYTASNPEVIVYHQKNEGVSAARNKGIDFCSGDFLYFIDSDDLPCIDVLIDSIHSMIKNSADMFICGYELTDMNRSVIKKCTNRVTGAFDSEKACIQYVTNQIHVCMGSFLVRKSALSGIRFPLGIRYGEDMTFIAECIANANTVWIDNKILLLYRQNGASAMHKLDLSRFDNYYARLILRDYIQSRHSKMISLLQVVDEKYIPEVIESDIKLLCHYGFSYIKLRKYLQEHRIDKAIEKIVARNRENDESFPSLSLWVKEPFLYYLSERFRRIKYLLRSSIGRIKRKNWN
jgi:glycosyltransferase involved in cell wall biosynthesis